MNEPSLDCATSTPRKYLKCTKSLSGTFEQDMVLVVQYPPYRTTCENNVIHIYNEIDTFLGERQQNRK